MSKEGSRSKRPTLTDVAKLVGVSPSTVSRVLRDAFNPCPISHEVQRRVLEAVEKLGYRPHPIAQALSTRRTYIVGLVLLSPTQLTHPYTAAIVQGDLEVSHQRGYHISGFTSGLVKASWGGSTSVWGWHLAVSVQVKTLWVAMRKWM